MKRAALRLAGDGPSRYGTGWKRIYNKNIYMGATLLPLSLPALSGLHLTRTSASAGLLDLEALLHGSAFMFNCDFGAVRIPCLSRRTLTNVVPPAGFVKFLTDG